MKVTLTIDRSLRELADRYGVNLSMLLELALIRYFYKMHGIVVRTRPTGASIPTATLQRSHEKGAA